MESLHGPAPPLPSSPPSPFATASVRAAIDVSSQRPRLAAAPLAPAIVILVGLAVAMAIGAFGVANLATASDDHAAARAELLATTLGARLSRLPTSEWLDVMQLAARKTGAEFVVISRDGDVVFDASLGMADRAALKRVVAVSSGEAVTGLGRARFGTEPLVARGLSWRRRCWSRSCASPARPRRLLRSFARWSR